MTTLYRLSEKKIKLNIADLYLSIT